MRFASIQSSNKWFCWRQPDPAEIERQFRECVRSSHLHLWAPGDPIGEEIRFRLLICIATWSLPDLELLDEVEAKLRSLAMQGKCGIRVDVFSFDSLTDVSQCSLYYPEFQFSVTPVIGLWESGIHQCTRLGAAQLVHQTLARA
jgi:hypothetical protein